jgi:lipopolysaccharide/colanic/teichoic acid biosynthesis glycosyltransferase
VSDLEDKLRYYAERHMVKPGITGWAQINYPYGASIEDARNKLNTISITPRTTPRSSTC